MIIPYQRLEQCSNYVFRLIAKIASDDGILLYTYSFWELQTKFNWYVTHIFNLYCSSTMSQNKYISLKLFCVPSNDVDIYDNDKSSYALDTNYFWNFYCYSMLLLLTLSFIVSWKLALNVI